MRSTLRTALQRARRSVGPCRRTRSTVPRGSGPGPTRRPDPGITGSCDTAGFHEPGAGLSIAVNRDVFEGLTSAQQKIVEIAAAESHQWTPAPSFTQNRAALQRLRSGGVQFLTVPETICDAFGVATRDAADGFMEDALFAMIGALHDATLRSSWH